VSFEKTLQKTKPDLAIFSFSSTFRHQGIKSFRKNKNLIQNRTFCKDLLVFKETMSAGKSVD